MHINPHKIIKTILFNNSNMEYDLISPWKTLDPWQKDFIKAEGDITVVSGRQCGKTEPLPY